jgi:hypothetical protein
MNLSQQTFTSHDFRDVFAGTHFDCKTNSVLLPHSKVIVQRVINNLEMDRIKALKSLAQMTKKELKFCLEGQKEKANSMLKPIRMVKLHNSLLTQKIAWIQAEFHR